MKPNTLTPIGISGAINAINKIFAKAAPKLPEPKQPTGLKEPDVNTVEAPTTEEPEKKPLPQYPDFPFSISRSLEGLGDEEIELAIQVTHYRPPGNNRGLDSRDPAFDGGSIEFGDAVVVATGKTIELSPMEWDAVEEAFWN